MKFFSLISSTAALSALTMAGFCDTQMTDLESRVSGLEKTHTLAVENSLSHQQNGYNGGNYSSSPSGGSSMDYTGAGSEMYPKTILDSARGCHKENGFTFDLEFLWLRAVEDGLEYAFEINRNNGNPTYSPKGQDFQFDPGFRVGLGYNFGYDGWDLHLGYMWHYTHPNTSINGQYVDGRGTVGWLLTILPVNDGSLAYLGYESAKSNWQNQFNAWDLDLGRNFYVGKHLAVKPTLGLKATIIRQHLHLFFNQTDRRDPQQNNQYDIEWNEVRSRFKSRFWGVGPKVGFSGEWELGSGFSLMGQFHTAALYGESTRKADILAIAVADRVDDPSEVGLNQGGYLSSDAYRLRMMAHTAIGLEWSRCFWNWMNFQIHLGWEAEYWWNQMDFISFVDASPNHDLSLTGINAGLRFEF